jgi:hypothetical protein
MQARKRNFSRIKCCGATSMLNALPEVAGNKLESGLQIHYIFACEDNHDPMDNPS